MKQRPFFPGHKESGTCLVINPHWKGCDSISRMKRGWDCFVVAFLGFALHRLYLCPILGHRENMLLQIRPNVPINKQICTHIHKDIYVYIYIYNKGDLRSVAHRSVRLSGPLRPRVASCHRPCLLASRRATRDRRATGRHRSHGRNCMFPKKEIGS